MQGIGNSGASECIPHMSDAAYVEAPSMTKV